MREGVAAGLSALALLVGPMAVSGAAVLQGDERADEGGPVVLELFTSQGCGTCPPAHSVLSRLGPDEKTRARGRASAWPPFSRIRAR